MNFQSVISSFMSYCFCENAPFAYWIDLKKNDFLRHFGDNILWMPNTWSCPRLYILSTRCLVLVQVPLRSKCVSLGRCLHL